MKQPSVKLSSPYLTRLGHASFANGLRFHNDSAFMLAHQSFQSATFLSVHAQEELGKALLCANLSRRLKSGEISPKDAEIELNKRVLKNHVEKQFTFGLHVSYDLRFESLIADPTKFQRLRDKSLYVGSATHSKMGVVRLSTMATRKMAVAQIDFINAGLEDLVDRGYKKKYRNKSEDEFWSARFSNSIWWVLTTIEEICASAPRSGSAVKTPRFEDALEMLHIWREGPEKKDMQLAFRYICSALDYE